MEKPKETKSENKIVSKSFQTIHSSLIMEFNTGSFKSQQTQKNILGFHSCNECFVKINKQNKAKESSKGNWEGRKALIFFQFSTLLGYGCSSIQFSYVYLQEGSYWLDLAQMN